MRWPDRDFQRWHVTPDRDQYKVVYVHEIKNRREVRVFHPRICEAHFCTIAECMWSFYSGMGYPLEVEKYTHRPYWSHMARLNRRWQLKSKWERDSRK